MGKARKTRHILVTGGAGFIGSHLVERLLTDGHDVVVIDDCSTGRLENLRRVKNHPHLRVLTEKISDCKRLRKLVAGAAGIYHLAAAVGVELVLRSPVRTLETNLKETEIILKEAAANRVPILITSSSEVYGKSTKPAFAEEDDLLIGPPHVDRWSYACSKLMDEFLALAYAREYGLPAIIARLFNTVGPRQSGHHGMVLPRFIAAARAGKPIPVFGEGTQTRCFCYVLDTVEALVRLQQAPNAPGQVFNVGSTEEVSILQLAETVRKVLRSKSPIQSIPYAKAYGPDARFEDMQRRRPVVAKLQQAIGYRPETSLTEIIRLTAGV